MTDHRQDVLRENTTDQQGPDILKGLVNILSAPANASALSALVRKNPVRMSMDTTDPSAFLRTNADGTVARGHLDDEGRLWHMPVAEMR